MNLLDAIYLERSRQARWKNFGKATRRNGAWPCRAQANESLISAKMITLPWTGDAEIRASDPVDPTDAPIVPALELQSSNQCRRWFFEDLPQTIADMPMKERCIGSPELVKIVRNWPLKGFSRLLQC